jgi:hypothetical protein
MTTENEPVHPMLMRAARAISALIAEHMGDSLENVWTQVGRHHINIAQAALTECGALDCLEALERLRGEWAYQCSKGNVPEGRVEAEMADAAIAKVYGSAP